MREEGEPAGVAPGRRIASASRARLRLSRSPVGSIPDDELIDVARKAGSERRCSKQVQRMLADPKSQALIGNFAASG
jgi:hypothetical protein